MLWVARWYSDSEVTGLISTRTAVEYTLQEVSYTHGAKANSAFHPSGVGKYSLLKIVSRCRRTLRSEGHSAAGWGIGGCVELLLRVQSPFVWAMGGRR